LDEDTPQTFTAEHRSFEWELVLQYEDGSLPASAFTEATLGVVAGWYAKNLPPDQARRRYEDSYHRNRRRLANRLAASAEHTEALNALDAVWQDLLARRLGTMP
jgi:hypothetical protein